MRLVVKVGTNTLSAPDGTLDIDYVTSLVDQIARLKQAGHQVILVSSGAVGAGRSIMQLEGSALPEKQVYAAIGQAHLIRTYSEALSPHGIVCAQVLATKLDFQHESHKKNMSICLRHLLHDDILPIVNENDVVAVDEIIFTDNDELAGLIAELLQADLALFMTSVDGILDAAGQVIADVPVNTAADQVGSITSDTSVGGRGGMTAKFAIAKRLALRGIAAMIVHGRRPDVLLDACAGKPVGTRVVRSATSLHHPK
jgi:glutamate 5-kinase